MADTRRRSSAASSASPVIACAHRADARRAIRHVPVEARVTKLRSKSRAEDALSLTKAVVTGGNLLLAREQRPCRHVARPVQRRAQGAERPQAVALALRGVVHERIEPHGRPGVRHERRERAPGVEVLGERSRLVRREPPEERARITDPVSSSQKARGERAERVPRRDLLAIERRHEDPLDAPDAERAALRPRRGPRRGPPPARSSRRACRARPPPRARRAPAGRRRARRAPRRERRAPARRARAPPLRSRPSRAAPPRPRRVAPGASPRPRRRSRTRTPRRRSRPRSPPASAVRTARRAPAPRWRRIAAPALSSPRSASARLHKPPPRARSAHPARRRTATRPPSARTPGPTRPPGTRRARNIPHGRGRGSGPRAPRGAAPWVGSRPGRARTRPPRARRASLARPRR